MAIIGELAGPQQRKAAFALTRLAINLGMSIGPVAGGFLAMHSFKLLFYVDGATSLLAGVLIATLPWRQINPRSLEKDVIQKNGDNIILQHRYSDVLRDRLFIYFLLAMIPIQLVFFQPLAAMPLFLVRDLHHRIRVRSIAGDQYGHYHSGGSCFECSHGRLDPSLCNCARRSFGRCRFRCVDFRQ
jgi:MFS family permease